MFWTGILLFFFWRKEVLDGSNLSWSYDFVFFRKIQLNFREKQHFCYFIKLVFICCPRVKGWRTLFWTLFYLCGSAFFTSIDIYFRIFNFISFVLLRVLQKYILIPYSLFLIPYSSLLSLEKAWTSALANWPWSST